MKKYLIVLMAVFSLLACAKKEEASSAAPQAKLAAASNESARKNFLAYTHTLSIQAKPEGVSSTHTRIVEGCKAAGADCMLLDSNLSQGEYMSAHVRMRLKPAALKQVFALATSGNTVIEQNTSAEDLALPVQDNAKRLELLASYQKRLLALEQKSGSDLDSLIKLSKEIATVQTELEQAGGEKAQLFSRIDMEVLDINISTGQRSAFWRPIGNALSGFLDHLSSSISAFITASAYLLPWIIVLLIAGFGIRKFRLRKKQQNEPKNT